MEAKRTCQDPAAGRRPSCTTACWSRSSVAGRYYQVEAVKAVCHAFDTENRRKALLVMATSSGKTRTTISLVEVLLRQGWVKNALLLTDRTSLVTQVKWAFANLLPDSVCEPATGPEPHPPLRGPGKFYRSGGVLHLPDHDRLH